MKSYHQASGGVKPGLRVLLAGGGSGGSAAPVIAVAEAIRERQPETELLYVGTRTGPEAQLASAAGLRYVGIPTGRFRRYGTWRNLTDPVLVLVGLCRAQAIVHRFGPTLAFGAGGFATVPPLLAARLGRARVGVHQQDVAWGLANRMLAPFASHRTCAFEETCQRLTSTSAISVGNPVRRSILLGDPTVGRAELGLDANRPLVLATGGGTGAARLNDLLVGAAPELLKCCQIVHLVGAGKAVRFAAPGYHQLEFVTDLMPHLLAAADVVLSRAGMSSLSELAALRKPAIVVPMPGSHQEANGAAFGRAGAALVIAEPALTTEGLCDAVLLLLEDRSARDRLGAAAARVLPFDAAGRIADSLLRLAGY